MSAEMLRGRIGGNWAQQADGWWLTVPVDQIRSAARVMREGGARFAALVAREIKAGALHLAWHWDFQGTLLSIETELARGDPVPSIADIYHGADWAERETRDYYGVSFTGRAHTPPLMLRDDDTPGILLNSEGSCA
jgi:NADH-quinone oxidoreductase subunit C